MSAQQHVRPTGSRQSPAVMSLQREVSTAQDASLPPEVRAASLSKLHAVMAAHQANRPSVAVALLPWFLAGWPQLVACLWDPSPQLPAAVAPLLGIVGGLVASSRGAAAAVEAAAAATRFEPAPAAPLAERPAATVSPAVSTAQQQQQRPAAQAPSSAAASLQPAVPGPGGIPGGPPVPPAGLLFDWLLPLLTGKVGIPPAGSPAPLQLQVLICKTLIYALQQLPSCTPASFAGPAAAPTATCTVSSRQPQENAVRSSSSGSVDTTCGSSNAHPGLLTAPVPEVAARQLKQHAVAVLGAVQELLEAVTTPPALLAPLLQLLLEVIRLDFSVITGSVLRDLLDLLLGWSLEPGLQPMDRQLITGVLSACKPCWLAEPQLVADVGSKLLTDLQQLLPSQGATLDAAAEAGDKATLPATTAGTDVEAGTAADGSAEAATEQQQWQDEQQTSQQVEQQHKFVALLSCLVAILHAASSLSSCQKLVTDTAALMSGAHAQYCAAGAVDHRSCAAAAQLATLMLALWQPVATASFDRAAKSVLGAAVPGASSLVAQSAVESGGIATGQGGAGATSLHAQSSSASCDVPGMFSSMWGAVLRTLSLPLLLSEDAVGVMEAMSNTLSKLGQMLGQQRQQDTHQAVDDSSQHVDDASMRTRLHQLAMDIPAQMFAASLTLRHTPISDVQAAAGCLYTSALLLEAAQPGANASVGPVRSKLVSAVTAELEAISTRLVCPSGAGSTVDSSNSVQGSAAAADGQQQPLDMDGEDISTKHIRQQSKEQEQQQQLKEQEQQQQQLEEQEQQQQQLKGQEQQQQLEEQEHQQQQLQAAYKTLSQQQLLAVLFHDLATLESWLCSCDGQQQQQQTVQACSTSAATASVAAASAADLARCILRCMQHFIHAGAYGGLLSSDGILRQLLAVSRALIASRRPEHDSARNSSDVDHCLLQCLQLPLEATGADTDNQCDAIKLLGDLLLLQLQQPSSHIPSGPACSAPPCGPCSWQQALPLLASAANAPSAAVRGAAVATAGKLALELWQQAHPSPGSTVQPSKPSQCTHTAHCKDQQRQATWLPALLQVLISSCADLDAHVASAALACANRLALPIFLTSACNIPSASAPCDNNSISSSAVSSRAWLRTVALQQQQRGFKPSQLAQLFEQLMQASPLLLQRRPGGSAAWLAALPQQQQLQWHAQADALYRLAQTLPVLPPSGVSSGGGKHSPSGGEGVALTFEALTSAASTNWLLVQEAARHCVSARLRTHLGTPTQTFNMLEKLLQTMLHRLHTDGSPAAAERAWQLQLQQQLQSIVPQQQQQPASGEQHHGDQQQQTEPQMLLQAPTGPSARHSSPHPSGSSSGRVLGRSKLLPHMEEQQQQQGLGGAHQHTPESMQAAEQQRVESEAAAASMLDFMLALEVNMQAAGEGSFLRPTVSKSVMAFFAGNKKVCEDWLCRTRETLLSLAAATGAHQYTIYHGMARLQELQATLRNLTKHYQAQQQQLQQQQQQYAKQQEDARQRAATSSTAAAAAAAAIAITGLGGSGQLGDTKGRQGKQRGKQPKGQQQQQQDPNGSGAIEPAKLKTKEVQAAADGRTGSSSSSSSSNLPAALQEQRKALTQSHQAAVLRLAAPLLSVLVLLADALIAQREHSSITGLTAWVHSSFNAVWTAVSRFYALDLGLVADVESSSGDEHQYTDVVLEFGPAAAGSDVAGSGGGSGTQKQQQQQQSSTMLLLSWLPGAAAEAAGRYEEALQLHKAFIHSEACAVPLGACLRGFVLEHLAACYAAVGDWQGLADLAEASNKAKDQHAQQQQQQLTTAQHWTLAGTAGLAALQQWQLEMEQQNQGQQRSGGPHRTLAVPGGLQLLDADACCNIPGLTRAGQAILNALGALQSGSSSSSTSMEQLGQQHKHDRHHRHGAAPAAMQLPQTPQQQQLPAVLAQLHAQLQHLGSSPIHVLLGGSRSSNQHWLQLSLLQLLQDAVADKADPQHGQQGAAKLGQLLEALASQRRRAVSSTCCWDGALDQAGMLGSSCFADVLDVMPLVQVISAGGNPCSGALKVLIREALLTCHAGSCSNAQQRLLRLAEAACTGEGDQAWLQLVRSKLLMSHSSGSCIRAAVEAHVKVLSEHGAQSRLLGSEDSSSCTAMQPPALAAAYLSLAGLLSTAKGGQPNDSMDWHQLHERSLQLLAAQDDKSGMSGGLSDLAVAAAAEAATAHAVPPQHLPAAACCAAAAAATPAAAAPWKAYGDVLHTLAAEMHPQQLEQQQQQHLLLAAAAEAYCNHLAAAVNSKALATPEQGLQVLLRLLEIILEHGDAVQVQLQQALRTCPVSAWQVLTPQLLGQLQHSSAAVRMLVQQLLQGLTVVVPCAVLYPLVVEVRTAEEAGQEPPAELAAVLDKLQGHQPRLLADTVAMAAALEGLTVTPREAWAGLLMELGLEVNRKLLALQADASRLVQQGLDIERRIDLITTRYHTVMSPVLAVLQQHLTAAAAAPPGSPDEAAFRDQMLPQLQQLLDGLQQPPAELLRAVDEPQQEEQEELESKQMSASRRVKASTTKPGSTASATYAPLKQLQQQLSQQLRKQQRLELAKVAPLLSRLKNTAIPLPADDLTAFTLPPLPLHGVLDSSGTAFLPSSDGRSDRQVPVSGAAVAATAASGAGAGSGAGNWLCIAGFDQTVLVLPTKTRPKRLRLLANDGSTHAFLLKGRDDLRVDERLMQFLRAANALLTAPATPNAPTKGGASSSSCSATGTVGFTAGRVHRELRVRPYSITPFGRRAGLVQWVRHTTSLFGLVRAWQSATAERLHAVAAAKRDAAAGAAGADASTTAAASADGSTGSGAVLPLMVAAARPADAFYARLLPALQAAGFPVGAPRSQWPTAVLRSTFTSLMRDAPKLLLARQLLSSAASPAGWWASQQCFATSAAVGSMLGWLLGLGDRHLDNLLLDTESGEVLHIDFSVCFDKGAGLGVPEVVPFRLTQMMQSALGPGGLAGTFSAAASTVLSTLRSSSEMLAALLALLLADPAVDWSVEREAHAARKDQDTSVSLKLFASRMEELHQPLLAGLAAALPTIGNGLAAVVSYGEAHLYMQQLQSAATAARSRAAAAKAALAEATDGEVKALTDGAAAAQKVSSLISDYRRLCGLASSCLSSAANWLARHQETLHTLSQPVAMTRAGMLESPSAATASVQLQGLVVQPAEWSSAACDRSLLLLGAIEEAAHEQHQGLHGAEGILHKSLGPMLAGGASSSSSLLAVLPAELLQRCRQVDHDGHLLLQQQSRLMLLGRWAMGAYAAVLQQLLPSEYIHHSHHWAWSHAFTAAASGPSPDALATAAASAPLLPSPAAAAATWACLAACWVECQLQQQQHAAAVSAAAVGTSELAESAAATQLGGALKQLEASLGTADESESARVQLVSSQALAAVCNRVQGEAGRLEELVDQAQQQPELVQASQLFSRCSAVQQHLAALQAALSKYQQSGLSYILDLSSSMATDELPEAPATLEELLEQHSDGDDQIHAAVQQHQQLQQHLHQWVADSALKLQLLQQLMTAIKYEALPQLAPWAAAAAAKHDSRQGRSSAADAAADAQSHAIMMPAGPVSQVQLWNAAAVLVHSTWQQLQQHVQHVQQLNQQMQVLAAVAAAGGATGIPAYHTQLLVQAEQLQTLLLPQGYDITVAEDCVAAAQLLQLQWAELERAFAADLGACLCPLLGLSRVGLEQWSTAHSMLSGTAATTWVDEQALLVLQQLLAATTAGVAAGTMMHSKDVFDALAGSAADDSGGAAVGDSSGGSADAESWGTPLLSAAWKSLIVLLMQCGCLQQDIQQQQPPVAAAADSNCSTVDVLQGGILPLDFEQYRPLVFVVQVLHALLRPAASIAPAPSDQQGTPASAVAASALYEQIQRLLVPTVSGPLLSSVKQHMSRLQHHLQLLGSEATTVLQRQQQVASSTRAVAPGSSPAQQQQHANAAAVETVAEAASSQDMGLGGLDSGLECGELVPFNAFDPSLPGADMTLEGEELGGFDEERLQGAEIIGQGGELVPFDAFDPILPGAGMMLEADSSGGPGALEYLQDGGVTAQLQESADQGQVSEADDWWLEEQQAQQDAGPTATEQQQPPSSSQLPELVPFSDFDPALPGAGTLLEAGATALALDADQAHASSEPALVLATTTVAAAGSSDGSGGESTGGDCAAQWHALGQQLLTVGLQQAQQLSSQQQLAALQQAGPSVEWQLQTWLRHVAAFEWLWGDVLDLAQQLEGDQHDTQLYGGSPAKQLLAHLVEAAAMSLGMPSTDSNNSSSLDAEHEPGAVLATAAAVAAAAAAALSPGDAYQWYFTQLGLLSVLPHHPDQDGAGSTAAPLSSLLEAPQEGGAAAGQVSGTAAGQDSGVLRMPSRSQLLRAWQEVSETLPGLQVGLTAWQDAVAAAAAAVRDEVVQLAAAGQKLTGDASVCFKVLFGLCNRSQHWCSSAAGLLAGVSQLGEAALQLEYSRRGRLWAPGMPDGVDAFQGNASLLQQLRSAAAALADAEAEAAAAEALLMSSQAAAQQAELTLDEAAQEEATAEYELALKTPAALARAQALTGFLNPMVEAAAAALTLVTEGTGSTLRALMTLVERNSAARDLAPITNETVAQHARCAAVLKRLHSIGSAAAAGLQEALALHRQQQQSEQQQQDGQQPLDGQQQQRLLQVLLVCMQPALQGVKQELHELGQAHILFTQLTHQLDSLAAAAETVAAAITADHALQTSASGASSSAAAKAAGASVRRARAEVRRRAFAAAALARCTARLTGKLADSSAAGREATSTMSGAAAADAPCRVEDEVASLVAQATSVDRLSRMYEGWAAWL